MYDQTETVEEMVIGKHHYALYRDSQTGAMGGLVSARYHSLHWKYFNKLFKEILLKYDLGLQKKMGAIGSSSQVWLMIESLKRLAMLGRISKLSNPNSPRIEEPSSH